MFNSLDKRLNSMNQDKNAAEPWPALTKNSSPSRVSMSLSSGAWLAPGFWFFSKAEINSLKKRVCLNAAMCSLALTEPK
ncbi:MAG: hypothetical protein EBS01_03805 [Verrucomicrobia bacterium]|nr:hypothetical protein [Verrucomicrobiota bacterium]